MKLDLLIKEALVYDGSGRDPTVADIAVRDGRIVALAPGIAAHAAQVRDANGLALAPGFVDLHTHYDAQITWDPTLSPSPALGVTTVVIGNCGFGIAPCGRDSRDLVMENLAVVEGMDLEVLKAGMVWQFHTFGDYLAQLERGGVYPNVAVLVGHTPVRLAVMGPDAARRTATDEEVARMRALVVQAMESGAVGFATSVSRNHTGFSGLPVPSRLAGPGEMQALADALRETGKGVFGTVGQQQTPDDLASIARFTGRPVLFNAAFYMDSAPGKALEYLDGCVKAKREGLNVHALVSALPIAMEFTLENAMPLFSNPAWDSVRGCSPTELRRVLAGRRFRTEFIRAFDQPSPNMAFQGDWALMELSRPASEKYRRFDGTSIAVIASDLGKDPVDVFFDIALEEDLATLYTSNTINANEDRVEPLLLHDGGIISASDAGAHIDFMCNAGYGLHVLGHWVRERGAMPLQEAVRRLTAVPAAAIGLRDRGRLLPGYRADLLLFDPATVRSGPKRRANDLPGGGTRVMVDPVGVRGVWVNGVEVFDGSEYTALPRGPGHVLRHFS
jgi:N-acyl-D-amino-acid deacylase